MKWNIPYQSTVPCQCPKFQLIVIRHFSYHKTYTLQNRHPALPVLWCDKRTQQAIGQHNVTSFFFPCSILQTHYTSLCFLETEPFALLTHLDCALLTFTRTGKGTGNDHKWLYSGFGKLNNCWHECRERNATFIVLPVPILHKQCCLWGCRVNPDR